MIFSAKINNLTSDEGSASDLDSPVDRGSLFGEFEPVLDQLDGNEILDFQ